MKDKFVTYPQAVELSWLGFNEPCFALVNTKEQYKTLGSFANVATVNSPNTLEFDETASPILAPTYEQALKFLYDKYKVSYYTTPIEIKHRPDEHFYKVTIKSRSGEKGIFGSWDHANVPYIAVRYGINKIFHEVEICYPDNSRRFKDKDWFAVEIKNIQVDFDDHEDRDSPTGATFDFLGKTYSIRKNGTYDEVEHLFFDPSNIQDFI